MKQYEKERATNKCLQIMFSSVSHEFRTPLNTFSNAITLLNSNISQILKIANENISNYNKDKKKIALLDESSKRFVTMGEISSKILINLVEDILDLAKIEAGTFLLNKEPFVIRSLVNEIKFIFGLQWQQKGIELKFIWDDKHKILYN